MNKFLTGHSTRIPALALTLLLMGCPDPDKLVSIESGTLVTENIGFEIRLLQEEDQDEIDVWINIFASTDGASKTAAVNLSTSDRLLVSVVDQDLEPVSTGPAYSTNPTSFQFRQSALSLPATFQISLIRDADQPDAPDSYVTLSAVFETISPAEAASFNLDSSVEFAWALRDGDGNTVSGANNISGIWTQQPRTAPEQFIVGNSVNFENINVGVDGYSSVAILPASSLIPTELRQSGNSPWDLEVKLSEDSDLTLPATFDIDPALANSRRDDQLFRHSGRILARSVPITVR